MFINPLFNNRRRFIYPRVNPAGMPLLHTLAAITHLIDAAQAVTYSLHPLLFRLLPKRGVLLLEIRNQPVPTPNPTDPVYISVTGNPLGAPSNRIPLMLPDGTQATVENVSVGGHYLVSFNKCECSFQLLNVVSAGATAEALAAPLAAQKTTK